MTRQYEKRYDKMRETMELLGIVNISTPRQVKNGTVVWRLPIKYSTHPKFIEVASFATGYVRNQNGGYSNYQLNKRIEVEDYHPEYKMEQGCCVTTGKFYKYKTRSCELIPREIDRLEYLIGYCLKNYYIKLANQVVNGDYIPKWTHKYEMNGLQNKLANSVPKWKYDEAMKLGREQDESVRIELESSNYEFSQKIKDQAKAIKVYEERVYSQDCGHYDRIQDLEKELSTYKGDVVPEWKHTDAMTKIQDLEARLELRGQSVRDLEDQVYDLENKLSNAISPTKHECAKARTERASDRIHELENKLQSIIRTARH